MSDGQKTAINRTHEAAQTLRKLILSGKLAPGERLQAQRLADQLHVSRTPIAGALEILSREGLLEYGLNRGYTVKSFGLKTFYDAYDARQALEGMACRLVAERQLSAQARSEIDENLQESEDVLFGSGAWEAASQERWRILNFRFHDLIINEAQNDFIRDGVAATRALPLIFNHSFSDVLTELFPQLDLRFTRESLSDHRRIADALFAGQATRAENMMREHIYTGRQKGRAILVAMGVATDEE